MKIPPPEIVATLSGSVLVSRTRQPGGKVKVIRPFGSCQSVACGAVVTVRVAVASGRVAVARTGVVVGVRRDEVNVPPQLRKSVKRMTPTTTHGTHLPPERRAGGDATGGYGTGRSPG